MFNRTINFVMTKLCGIMLLAAAAQGRAEAVLLAVDATAPGRVLPNVSKMLALWDLDGETFRDVARYREHDVLEFAEYVEIFGATGGNDMRDCLKNPRDRTVLDDYDFSRLVAGCRNIVHLGLKPYLKLGNVPNKFTTHNNPGEFGMNIRPPADYAVYGRYMEACANALLDAFGREELLKWRFAVLTEFGNEGWFKDASGDKEKSFRAYCRLYETTLDAFRKVISPMWSLARMRRRRRRGSSGMNASSSDMPANASFRSSSYPCRSTTTGPADSRAIWIFRGGSSTCATRRWLQATRTCGTELMKAGSCTARAVDTGEIASFPTAWSATRGRPPTTLES